MWISLSGVCACDLQNAILRRHSLRISRAHPEDPSAAYANWKTQTPKLEVSCPGLPPSIQIDAWSNWFERRLCADCQLGVLVFAPGLAGQSSVIFKLFSLTAVQALAIKKGSVD
eukprot:jgi/Botrbrau1/885/Bobra.0167s0009.1